MRKLLSFLQNLAINLLLNLWGAIPFVILAVLHFVLGIPLKWAFIALGLWIIYFAVRLLIITFFVSLPRPSREEEYRENKNPYSKKDERR